MPYSRFSTSELTLRDELAIARTQLANERTALAYGRTSLTFFIAGLSFLHFVPSGYLHYIGWFCLPAGAAAAAFGTWRFLIVTRAMKVLESTKPKAEVNPEQ